MRPRRLLNALLVLSAAAALSACGNKEETVTIAETEGIHVDAGGLDYQVQLSRQLNRASVEDAELLANVPEEVAEPTGDETWFAVWLRVANESEEPRTSSSEIEIEDTLGNHFEPVELGTGDVLGYRPERLLPGDVIPGEDSAAASGPIQGAVLIFKLPIRAFQNRPLELNIAAHEGEPKHAVVDLDL